MAILFMESGSDATQGLEFFSSTSGTVASSTAQAKTGPRSISLTDGYAEVNLNPTTGRGSLWIFPTTTPASTNVIFMWFEVGSNDFRIQRESTLLLTIRDGATNIRATGTIAIENNQWTHVAFSWKRTTSTDTEMRVWINGVLDINVTDFTWTGVINSLRFYAAGGGSGVAHYIDDIYIDDVSDLSFPGQIRVTAKLPVALNTNNFDTLVGSGTNRYDRVSERPLSVTNGIQHAAATDVQENFGIQAASTGDVNISDAYIVGHCGWVYAKRGDYSSYVENTQMGEIQSKT